MNCVDALFKLQTGCMKVIFLNRFVQDLLVCCMLFTFIEWIMHCQLCTCPTVFVQVNFWDIQVGELLHADSAAGCGSFFRFFWHNSRVWQTDRRTDRETDISLMAKTALHICTVVKKSSNFPVHVYWILYKSVSDMTPVGTTAQWRKDWLLACVVKHTVVGLCGQAHCCNWQPGYYLPHHTWCGLNSFKTARGPYLASLHRWGLANLFVNVDSCRPRTL